MSKTLAERLKTAIQDGNEDASTRAAQATIDGGVEFKQLDDYDEINNAVIDLGVAQ